MVPNNINLQGVVELHVHAGPDVSSRKMDAWELLRKAETEGMKAIVLKNHYVPTMLEAAVLNHKFGSIQVFGGIALNYTVGGLNPSAVETALKLDAKIVWMPTHDAENERAYRGNPGTGIRILDDRDQLVDSVREILDLLAERDCTLATGHLEYREIIALLKACRKRKVQRMLINHPGIVFQRFSVEQQQEMIKLGAYLEHSYCRPPHTPGPDELATVLKETGAQHVVLATDLGQPANPDPVTGMKELMLQLMERGFDQNEMDQMTRKNPSFLLNI